MAPLRIYNINDLPQVTISYCNVPLQYNIKTTKYSSRILTCKIKLSLPHVFNLAPYILLTVRGYVT